MYKMMMMMMMIHHNYDEDDDESSLIVKLGELAHPCLHGGAQLLGGKYYSQARFVDCRFCYEE